MAEKKTGAKSTKSKPNPKAKPKAKASKTGGRKVPGIRRRKSSGAKASTTTSKSLASKAKAKPAPNMTERMEGLQGWMAEIERKQERMTRFGGGAAILAVLAAGGALALGVINQQDASSKDDVDQLTEQVNELGASLKTDTEEQLKKISGRIDAVEQQISTVQQTQTQQTQDIANLKSQTAAQNKAGGTANGLDLQPALPGAKP
ncbi:hypothetical protein BH20ACT15_BH20ACT15_11520 [soil metagenome]